MGLILVFHQEIDTGVRRLAQRQGQESTLPWTAPAGTRGLIAVYLAILTLTGTKGLPGIGGVNEPAMAALYFGGVAQEYHLFDWIDRYNWYVNHTIEVDSEQTATTTVTTDRLFPSTVRGFIVQSYLLPVRWMRVPRPLTGEMRNSVLQRSAARFVRDNRESLGESGRVSVKTKVGRVSRGNLDVHETWEVELMTFDYDSTGVKGFVYPRMPGAQKV